MKPFACSVILPEELQLFSKIEKIIQQMPEIDLGTDKEGKKILVSCHMIARGLAYFFPVEWKDGYFGRAHQHSWLVTEMGRIIDPYPVALVGGPILVDTQFLTPWSSLYQEEPLPDLDNGRFFGNVKKVTEVIAETITALGINERSGDQ